MSVLDWNSFGSADGLQNTYHVSTDAEGGVWWRYGRNLGVYGCAGNIGEAKQICQDHHNTKIREKEHADSVQKDLENMIKWVGETF